MRRSKFHANYGPGFWEAVRNAGCSTVDPRLKAEMFPAHMNQAAEVEMSLMGYKGFKDQAIKDQAAPTPYWARLCMTASPPATIEDLLVYGKQFPPGKRPRRVIAVGSEAEAEVEGKSTFPCFVEKGGQRSFMLIDADTALQPGDYFLVVH